MTIEETKELLRDKDVRVQGSLSSDKEGKFPESRMHILKVYPTMEMDASG